MQKSLLERPEKETLGRKRKLPRVLLVEALGNKCKNCGSEENLEIDHIVALSDGGTDSPNNLQVLCFEGHKKKHGAYRPCLSPKEAQKAEPHRTALLVLYCKRCAYFWDYKGKSQWYTSCPRCKTTVRVRNG